MNFITIAGSGGSNAELRQLPSGEVVAHFSLADIKYRLLRISCKNARRCSILK